MRRATGLLAGLAAALLPLAGAVAAPDVVQIGGGDSIRASQGQIEANVLWLNDLLPKVSGRVAVYFASGPGEGRDVALWAPGGAPSPMSRLARLFGDGRDDRLAFRHNVLPHVDGSTRKAELVAALGARLAALPPDGEMFLVYNGHGGLAWPNVRDNYLRLWGEERLTVAETARVLDHAPAGATVRFILPQCYSGAFYDLVLDRPEGRRLAARNRCGFFAQSAYRESEGCSLSVEKEEFRDYTTYYFAPLNGRTRLDGALPSEPDLNGDGRLSYREGHLYMLRHAESKDLARATSEVFLERWEPWYLRFGSLADNQGSVYWRIAEAVAARNGLTLDGAVLRGAHRRLAADLRERKADFERLKTEIADLRADLRTDLEGRWPELFHPYTAAYRELVAGDLEGLNAFLATDTRFARLDSAQDGRIEAERQILEAERRLAQVDKVIRFKKLARLEAQFDRYASADDKADYRRLLACEEGDMAAR